MIILCSFKFNNHVEYSVDTYAIRNNIYVDNNLLFFIAKRSTHTLNYSFTSISLIKLKIQQDMPCVFIYARLWYFF